MAAEYVKALKLERLPLKILPDALPSRRTLIIASIGGLLGGGGLASASTSAETIGKDENCNESTCLGVWDGLLADCPHNNLRSVGGGAGCAASQDDTPGIFAEPWDFSEVSSKANDWHEQMNALNTAISLVSTKRGDQVETILQQGRYLRVVFTDGTTQEQSVGEFYFTPNDTTVQFRVASMSQQHPLPLKMLSWSNQQRCELIRQALGYEKLPVLRNRKRSFLFVESDDWDNFGPGSAALGSPAEMKPGEWNGR